MTINKGVSQMVYDVPSPRKRPSEEQNPTTLKFQTISVECVLIFYEVFDQESVTEVGRRYVDMTKILAASYIHSLFEVSENELNAIRLVADHEVLDSMLKTKINDFLSVFEVSDDSTDTDSIQSFKQLMTTFDGVLQQANERLMLGSVEEKILVKGLLIHLRKIAYSAISQISVRRVHSTLVNYIKLMQFQNYGIADFMAQNLLEKLPREGLRELAVTWDKAFQMIHKNKIPNTCLWNVPNQTFKLEFSSGERLSFFRFGSPSQELDQGTPLSIYRAMLEAHDNKNTRHMDLSLLRTEIWEAEIKKTSLRLRLQRDFPGTLIAWSFDFYSDFSCRGEPFHKKHDNHFISTNLFFPEFIKRLFTDSSSPFMLPYMANKFEVFKVKAQEIIESVNEDFFASNKYLSDKMTTAFIDITVVRLLEYFCELYRPQTCDTACFSHIDRGMELMTVLYYYLLIQNGQHQDGEHLQYMEEMIFAPSMFFEKRPTHSIVMTRLLNTLSFMQSDEVTERVKNRRTYFSGAVLKLPKY